MAKTDSSINQSVTNPAYDATYEPNGNTVPTNHSQVKLDAANENQNSPSHVTVKINNDNSKPWQPYEDSKFDSPVLNRYLFRWPTYYKIRWMILSVFHTRIAFGIVIGEIVFFLLILGR